MTEQIVTSFGPTAVKMGTRMIQSVAVYWPPSVPLVAYLDTFSRALPPRAEVRYTTAIPDWTAVKAKLRNDAPADGKHYKPTGYLWQAQRFAVKCYVWRDAAETLGTGVLAWLDADTVTEQAVPAGLLTSLLGPRASIAYLGRGRMHPETGVVVFRVPEALPVLRWCCEQYRTRRYRAFPTGWTDCHVLRAGMKALRVPAVNLLANRYDQPWTSRVDAVALSPFGPYLRHLKGKAKKREAA